MPEDFFADGFGEQQGVVFSKQEQQFLQKKIVFLDPMKTYQISIAKVLALLKYTKLDHQSIKKILQNSCTNGIGQKVITYDEMKKIFRGVALKQNKMEPSKINIEANIKTKMPVFYDDDDQSDEQQTPPTQSIKAQQQKKPVQPPTPSSSTISQQPKPQAPVDPLKAYDEYWKSLKTKNNLIDGAEVKKLYSNNNLNKANLSKSWKLCNLSQKGSLTKGQFFIFMNLINSSNIPETLTKQMKDFILKIQQACGYRKGGSQQSGQRVATSGPLPAQKQSERRPSDAFDKFGNESLFVKNASKVQQTTKQVTKNSSTVFPAVSASTTFGKPPGSGPTSSGQMSKSALFLLQKVQNLSKQQKVQEKQIQGITGNNQQLVAGLGAIEQFLAAVQKNMQATTSQIQVLKQTQQSLNQRLNNVCLQFKNIITKQTQCINFMKQTMHAQNQSNNARLQILQNYTNQMLSIAETTLQTTQNQTLIMKNRTQTNYNKVTNATQALGQRMKVNVQTQPNQFSPSPRVNQRPNQSPTTHQYQGYTQSDPFQDNEENQEHQRVSSQPQQIQRNISQTVTQQQKLEVRIQNNQNQPEEAEPQIYLQHLSPEQRKKTKQMLLIRILNSVSSMNEEEYAQVVNKVVAMTEEQMNQSYTKLHALYLQSLAKNPSLPKYPVPTPQQFTMPQQQ